MWMMVHQIFLFLIMLYTTQAGVPYFNIMVLIIQLLIMYLHVHHYIPHCILVILSQTVTFVFNSPNIISHGHIYEILYTTHFKEPIILPFDRIQMLLHHLITM